MNAYLLALMALTCCGAFPGSAAPHQQSLEEAVLAEMNYARAHPHDYAKDLREYRTWFEGNLVYLPNADTPLPTREGVAAVDAAIAFLERQAPLPPLAEGAVLALAARDMVTDQGRSGSMGHVSSDRRAPGDRVRRRGGDIYVGEIISYGVADPAGVVRQFIIDDGVPRRGHRALLFSRSYRFAGIACGEHVTQRHMCVVDLAASPDGRPQIPAGTN